MSASDLQARPVLTPHARVQKDPVSGDPVLLYPEGVLMLNATAEAILAQVNGIATIEQILAALAAEFEVTPDELQADVFEYLAELEQRRLLTLQPASGA